MSEIYLLIYSKYSDHCKELFSMMKYSGIDFNFIKMLCIDNDKVRKQVKANSKLQVNSVPCLLCLSASGAVQKFDGSNVFGWFQTKIQDSLPPPPPPQLQQPPPPPRRRKEPVDEEDEQIKTNSTSSMHQFKTKQKKQQAQTSIEDLVDEEEQEPEESIIQLKEPKTENLSNIAEQQKRIMMERQNIEDSEKPLRSKK